MSLPGQTKKKRLWEVDPSMFEPGRKAGFFERHVVGRLRQAGKLGLFGLAFAYPIILVYVGVAYGGLAFWSFFAGSGAIIGLTIWKLGYASNFANWDISLKRIIMLPVGFLIAVGFYSGLFYLKTWVVPIAIVLLGSGLFLVLRRTNSTDNP